MRKRKNGKLILQMKLKFNRNTKRQRIKMYKDSATQFSVSCRHDMSYHFSIHIANKNEV